MTSPDSRKTGATGIWTLEVNSGDIDLARSSTFTSLNWQGLLAVPVAFAGLKFLGEVVAGAFAGYAVKQLFPSDEQKDSHSIVLHFLPTPMAASHRRSTPASNRAASSQAPAISTAWVILSIST